MKKYSGYDLLLGGLFMAMALVFPVIFHAIGLGSAFLPMFYPIIAAGFLVALPVAIVVGVMSPLVSALITGMPPFFPPIGLIMMFEGAVLTAVPSLLYQRFKTNARVTAIITMAIDRLVLLFLVIIFSFTLELPEGVLSTAVLIKGIPGTVLILVLIPPLVKQMETKTRLARMIE
ncbi:ECF transporter S component [Acidobacteriota bacterium]